MLTKRRQISVILSRRKAGLALARKQSKSIQLNAGAASMRIVNIHEAKTHFSRLVDRAARGEPFAIAKAGKPMVKVVAFDAPRDDEVRRIGFMEGSIEVPDDFDRMGAEESGKLFSGNGCPDAAGPA